MLELELSTHGLQPGHVHVDRARSKIVAAGKGHSGAAKPGEQRTHDHDRGPHGSDQFQWSLGNQLSRHIDVEHVIFEVARRSEVRQHVTHELDIDDAGHIAQSMAAIGEDRCHHLLEGGVLGSERCDGTREAVPALDDDVGHWRIV